VICVVIRAIVEVLRLISSLVLKNSLMKGMFIVLVVEGVVEGCDFKRERRTEFKPCPWWWRLFSRGWLIEVQGEGRMGRMMMGDWLRLRESVAVFVFLWVAIHV
jgi:hypothetical protein